MIDETTSDKIEPAGDGEHAGAASEDTAASEDARPAGGEDLRHFLSAPVLGVLAAGFGASVAAPILVTKVADGVLSRQTRSFDHTLLDQASDLRHSYKKPLDPVMALLSGAGEPRTLYPVTAVTAVTCALKGRPADAATVALSVLGSAGLNQILKRVVHRPRPVWKLPFPRTRSSGSSFPSSHAAMSLATFGAVAFVLSRKRNPAPREDKTQQEKSPNRRSIASRIWAPVLLFCGLVGWSRVYQGVHNPTDVLGGWLVGGIWLLTCSKAAVRSQSL
jgi:undecaprenyl-diphosphatase